MVRILKIIGWEISCGWNWFWKAFWRDIYEWSYQKGYTFLSYLSLGKACTHSAMRVLSIEELSKL